MYSRLLSLMFEVHPCRAHRHAMSSLVVRDHPIRFLCTCPPLCNWMFLFCKVCPQRATHQVSVCSREFKSRPCCDEAAVRNFLLGVLAFFSLSCLSRSRVLVACGSLLAAVRRLLLSLSLSLLLFGVLASRFLPSNTY